MTTANRVDEAFDIIKNMTILEVADLVKRLETEFGVTAAAPVAVAAAPAAGGGEAGAAAAPAEEKTEFDVILTDFGANKVNVIKVVRENTSKEDAESIKKKLEEAGAKAEIK